MAQALITIVFNGLCRNIIKWTLFTLWFNISCRLLLLSCFIFGVCMAVSDILEVAAQRARKKFATLLV